MRISSASIFDRSNENIMSQQVEMARTQQMISTGRRIITASDDPAAASRIIDIEHALSVNQQRSNSQSYAKSQLELISGAIESSVNIAQDVRDLALEASAPGTTPQSRATMAATLRSYADQLISYANTRDSSGSSIFAGFQTDRDAFSKTGEDAVYQGDAGVRKMTITEARQIEVSISGADLFNNIKSGNGIFDAYVPSGNTGTATVGSLNTYDRNQLTGANYKIEFNGSGSAQSYTVTNQDTGALVVASTPVDGSKTVKFDGVSITFGGIPQGGDSILVNNAPNKSIFKAINELAAALESQDNTPSQMAKLASASGSMTRHADRAIDNFVDYGAYAGSRLREIDSLEGTTLDANILLLKEKGALQDLDYATAISTLSRQEVQIKAAQLSFSKLSQISIFQYLG